MGTIRVIATIDDARYYFSIIVVTTNIGDDTRDEDGDGEARSVND